MFLRYGTCAKVASHRSLKIPCKILWWGHTFRVSQNYWPWWLSGASLASVMVFHWLAVHRLMAVSSRFTALVERVRHGPVREAPAMDTAQLIAALQAETAAEFGAEAVPSPDDPVEAGVSAALSPSLGEPQRVLEHVAFFVSICVGSAIAYFLFGGGAPTAGLRSDGLVLISKGSSLFEWGLLGVGGLLVGFGTRMAGGCTSGHGMCGVSRVQPGSLLATVSFFGAGIVTSFALSLLFF